MTAIFITLLVSMPVGACALVRGASAWLAKVDPR